MDGQYISNSRRQDDRRPQSGEAPFHLGDVFYSRTNDKGIIESGNNLFQTVSDYSWDELLGAPHKIIRHPDMPSGVFSIFWSELKAGRITGAYVKNRAKDNLYYWVFALVSPCPTGFISARIKPSSKYFATIQQIYADQRAREREHRLSAEDSANELLATLADLGFPSYQDFVNAVLDAEVSSECTELGHAVPMRLKQTSLLLADATSLVEATNELVDQFDKLIHVPRNLQIKAMRVEANGGPFSVLCQNYNGISSDMQSWFASHITGDHNAFAEIKKLVSQALLLLSSAEVLSRCAEQLKAERRALQGIDIDEERGYLAEICASYQEQSDACYGSVVVTAQAIMQHCNAMKRMLSGLDTIRIAFKVEDARSANRKAGISDIISDLHMRQQNCETLRDSILSYAENIARMADDLKKQGPAKIPVDMLLGRGMAKSLGHEIDERG